MSFVINSCEWDFSGKDANAVSIMLEQFLERVDIANQRSENVYIGAELQSKHVCGNMDLWTFLYDPSMAEIDGSLLGELSAVLDNIECYEDLANWPPNFPEDAFFDDGRDLGLDLAFAHYSNLAKTPMGCITLSLRGTILTKSAHGSISVPLISDEYSHKKFWRKTALSMLRDTPHNLEALSPSMYPNLHFFEGVWGGISNFQGGYPRASHKLKKYLECLDDYGNWVFKAPPPAVHPSDTIESQDGVSPTNELIERRFNGLGLDMAPEKPNVRNDTKCYNARAVNLNYSIKGKEQTIELYCEWHGKLEQHTNRIHIHPPIVPTQGKVLIAIYHQHLPLP
ncbi:hypothetical protein [Vibrio scophthalmi]|uniref:Uncharacterized protein n=1 Tax=Vibrio scophthalmi TaxID=45658 RepID=A0A1E3WGT7_9VIBR|nr:hypothetical protein [Vibrio scophthalmi]ODS04742.1 hypothetical protein VSF3289_03881 [Vibrio scophthalmi]